MKLSCYLFLGNISQLISPSSGSNWLDDIHTGAGYKDIDPSHMGIIFNTDGISPFKSSRTTVWPVIIALSSLKPTIRMRKDNLVTIALWVGQSKPKFEELFSPLLKLFNRLSVSGLKINTSRGLKIYKFKALFGIFDLVAKAPVLSMNQFNGQYGCPTCLNPGVWNGSRYYLPDSISILRTNTSFIRAGKEAQLSHCIVNGIKSKSVLTDAVDLVNGFPIDYMHCVLEGVTKWLIEKWFHSSNHKANYYIGRQIHIIDSNLMIQKPPHEFSRPPRSVAKHRHHWKASEFRNWLLYYSLPLLSSILPPLYFHHYALLVCSMHILLQTRLNESMIKAAEGMLKAFYTMLPELYGPKSCTLNAHLLIHLTKYVRLWGPLWTHSLFGFESMNGHLTNMIHSTRKIGEQLSFAIDVCHTLGKLTDKLVDVENEQVLKFIASLSQIKIYRRNMTLLSPDIYSIGSLQSAHLSCDELLAVHELTGSTRNNYFTFYKLYMHDTIYYSCMYEGKRDSSICCFNFHGEKHYGIIQKFCTPPPLILIKPFNKTSSSLLKRAGNPCRELLKDYVETDLLEAFIVEVATNELLDVCAVSTSSLLSKCIKISCSNSLYSYIVHIPNNYEHH